MKWTFLSLNSGMYRDVSQKSKQNCKQYSLDEMAHHEPSHQDLQFAGIFSGLVCRAKRVKTENFTSISLVSLFFIC